MSPLHVLRPNPNRSTTHPNLTRTFSYRDTSPDQTLDDLYESLTHFCQFIILMLPSTVRYDYTAVAKQSKMVTDGGLALAQFTAQGGDMFLTLGKHQDYLETCAITDVFEEVRRSLDISPLVSARRTPMLSFIQCGFQGVRLLNPACVLLTTQTEEVMQRHSSPALMPCMNKIVDLVGSHSPLNI